MNVHDWRDIPAERLMPLYAAERERWLRTLQWDSAASWHEVEQARTSWGLPGLVATDGSGRLRGLAFFIAEQERIDIGGIVSDHESATDALLDGVIAAATRTQAVAVRIMAFDAAVALRSSLRGHGFELQTHLYLSRDLTSARDLGTRRPGVARNAGAASRPASLPPLDIWRDGDVEPIARLLQRSYDRESGELFAPANQFVEWQTYVANLVTHGACGVLNREATRLVRDGKEIRALALITDISPSIAHLVQMAVDPLLQGKGTGRALVEHVSACLAERHYRAITLMTSASNTRARALYDATGFRHDATFLSGSLKTLGPTVPQ
jgi:ribosomal protein S18 acetylase RimI-like enzyme